MRPEAEQKALWSCPSTFVAVPLQQSSKLTHILAPIFSPAPGIRQNYLQWHKDKTHQLAGPHHTSWVPSGASSPRPRSTSPHQPLDVSSCRSWLFKDGKAWRFRNWSVSCSLGKTALILHCKLSLSRFIFSLEGLFPLQGSLAAPQGLPPTTVSSQSYQQQVLLK